MLKHEIICYNVGFLKSLLRVYICVCVCDIYYIGSSLTVLRGTLNFRESNLDNQQLGTSERNQIHVITLLK